MPDSTMLNSVAVASPVEWWVVFATFAIAGATAVLAVLTYIGVRMGVRNQVFTEYTGRYSDIIASLPFEAGRAASTIRVSQAVGDERERQMKVMRRYFNLCWEEQHLRRYKRIDDTTWLLWHQGMVNSMRSGYFQEAWGELQVEYYDTEFVGFMAGVIKNARDLERK